MNTFEIIGGNEPARILFAFSDKPESIRAAAWYQGLHATWDVPFHAQDSDAFAAYFEDLSRSRGGWEGTKTVSGGRGDELVFASEIWAYITSEGRVEEVNTMLTLANDFQDPYWKVEIRLELRPDALPELAERASSFFATLKQHLETKAEEEIAAGMLAP